MIKKFEQSQDHKIGSGLGIHLAEIVRMIYPRDTAKHIARNWGIDASTAANVVRGHASERTIGRAFKTEGWGLIEALGTAVTGETYAQFVERDIARLKTEQELLQAKLEKIRAWDRAGFKIRSSN